MDLPTVLRLPAMAALLVLDGQVDSVRETLVLFALFLAMVALGSAVIGLLVWFTLHGLLH